MDIIPTQMSIGAALVVAVALFAYFLRRRRNRQAAKDALLD
jgi:hypothetical protein